LFTIFSAAICVRWSFCWTFYRNAKISQRKCKNNNNLVTVKPNKCLKRIEIDKAAVASLF